MKKTSFAGRFGLSGIKAARAAGLLLAGAMLGGCPAANQTPEPAATPNKVVIRGSNTIGEALAPQLITEFKKGHAAISFDLEAKMTGYGFAALRSGQCDIAAASRPAIKDEVEEASRSGVEFVDHFIGDYSITIVVNPKSAVTNLTTNQVRDIFTGSITNWKDVGGMDAPIHLFVRDPISGTYLGFRELAMENKPYAAIPTLEKSYEEIARAVAQDENGIGYCGMALPKDAAVKVVSIGGVEPTAASVNAGKYPYKRDLHLYTRKGTETPATLDFVQFVLSARGQEIMTQMGFVPHP